MINCGLFGIWERFSKMPFRLLIKNFIKRTPRSPYPDHKFWLMSKLSEYFGFYFGSL